MRSDRQGWMQAGGHFGLFCLTGAAVYLTWAQGLWIAFLVALFAHGTVASFFSGTAVHELGHGTVFKTKRLNGFFPVSLQPDQLVEPVRLCGQSHPSPPLHVAPGGRP